MKKKNKNPYKNWRTDYMKAIINDPYNRGADNKKHPGGKDYGPIIHEIIDEYQRRCNKHDEREEAKAGREFEKQFIHDRLVSNIGECSCCGETFPLTSLYWPTRDLERLLSGQWSGTCKACKSVKNKQRYIKVPF